MTTKRFGYYRAELTGRSHGNLMQEKSYTGTGSPGLILSIGAGSKNSIVQLAMNPTDADRALAADQNGALYLLDLIGDTFYRLRRFSSCITSLAFIPNNTYTTESGNDLQIDIVLSEVYRNSVHFIRLESHVRSHAGNQPGAGVEYDVSTSLVATFHDIHPATVDQIIHLKETDSVLLVSRYRCVTLWNISKLKMVKQMIDDRINMVKYLPTRDGSGLIMTGMRNGKIHIFNAATFDLIHTLAEYNLIKYEIQPVCPKHIFVALNLLTSQIQLIEFNLKLLEEGSDIVEVLRFKPLPSHIPPTIKSIFLQLDPNLSLEKYIALDGSNQLISNITSLDTYGQYFRTFSLVGNSLALVNTNGRLEIHDLKRLSKIAAARGRSRSVTPVRPVTSPISAAHSQITGRSSSQVPRSPTSGGARKEFFTPEVTEKILKNFSRFPAKYRFFIWTKLLQLPLDEISFYALKHKADQLAGHAEVTSLLSQMKDKFALMDTKLEHALIRTIRQLIVWNSDLVDISTDLLPLFIFPFVKILHKNQLILFELLATLLQNGFNSPPRVKSSVRELIENNEPRLASTYDRKQVSVELYVNSLIQSAFSEVFLKQDWLILWDHIIAYGPRMEIILAAAYNLQVAPIILDDTAADRSGIDLRESGPLSLVERLFTRPGSVHCKRLISTAHNLMRSQFETQFRVKPLRSPY